MDARLRNEIEHGKKIAGDADTIWGWTGRAGRLRWKKRTSLLLKGLGPGHSVLEVGCGTGALTTDLAGTGADIHAVEISNDLLEKARQRVPDKNVTFRCLNAYELDFKEHTFDFVVGNAVLHHFDVEKALAEFRRVLKEGGRIRFTEPNMLNPQIFLERHFFRECFNNSPDETAFVRFSLKRTLQDHRFRNITIVPFDFLHPRTSDPLVPAVSAASRAVEKIPILSEFAGSLFIEAAK